MENILSSVTSDLLSANTNIQSILSRNPAVANRDLEGAIRCNLIGFEGLVSVSTKRYQFASGEREARVISITPYNRTVDWLVTFKRLIMGVQFQGIGCNEDRVTRYVLGQLSNNDPNYALARTETDQALAEGRRLVVAVTHNDIKIEFERSHEGCAIM